MHAKSDEGDPFANARTVIKDLIAHLQEEANDEVEHQAWCDMEVSINERPMTKLRTRIGATVSERIRGAWSWSQ